VVTTKVYYPLPIDACHDSLGGNSFFSSLVDLALAGFTWEVCLAYLDDLIIFQNNFEQHSRATADGVGPSGGCRY